MRTRRHFQPVLDSLPVRIAPSSVTVSLPALVRAVSAPVAGVGCLPDDTLMPETGGTAPIILQPVTSPPGSLPC